MTLTMEVTNTGSLQKVGIPEYKVLSGNMKILIGDTGVTLTLQSTWGELYYIVGNATNIDYTILQINP